MKEIERLARIYWQETANREVAVKLGCEGRLREWIESDVRWIRWKLISAQAERRRRKKVARVDAWR